MTQPASPASPAPLAPATTSPPPEGTVERWAFDYVLSTDLAHKLRPPPPPDRFEEGAPPRRLDRPGRPASLEVATKAQKSPSDGALRDPKRRVQLFHTFLHHELQAAELMCWALLSFPELPPAMKRGVVRVFFDEIRHIDLYRTKIEALGGRFGDQPVRDWFWQRVPLAEAPAHFLAVMGMGLEAANLDHAARFAERLRAVGDLEGAAIEEQVGEEEVPHVAFALRWFDRLVEPDPVRPESAFSAWARRLPPPLSPLLMRGEPLNREARQRAGFSLEFLDELSSWQPRPPGS